MKLWGLVPHTRCRLAARRRRRPGCMVGMFGARKVWLGLEAGGVPGALAAYLRMLLGGVVWLEGRRGRRRSSLMCRLGMASEPAIFFKASVP